LTAEHIIISNNDVRAEPFLTGLIIASVYHFYRSITDKLNWHLVAASFFAACAIMTKGPFTLIPIGGAIAGDLIIRRNWKQVFHWRWMVAIILIALFITPELYSLWYQFDSHPEKTVFGKTNVSGIRFFLWDSQFGRFMNTTPMKGKGDPSFFLHTLLWAFLPWSLVMYAAFVSKTRSAIKTKMYMNQEWFTFTGSLLTILVFSLSKFQLSYYTNIVFPFLAVLTAQFLEKTVLSSSRLLKLLFNVISIILLVGGILLQVLYAPATPAIVLVLIIFAVLLLLILFPYRMQLSKNLVAFYRVGLASLVINLYINWFFYPDLLKYQSSTEAAFYINKNHDNIPGVVITNYAPAFEFYLEDGWLKADSSLIHHEPRSGIFYVTREELDRIDQRSIHYELLRELDEFHVTMLTLKFVNKKTRYKELKKCYLIKLL
jgi:hypothetical protein